MTLDQALATLNAFAFKELSPEQTATVGDWLEKAAAEVALREQAVTQREIAVSERESAVTLREEKVAAEVKAMASVRKVLGPREVTRSWLRRG